MAMANYDFDGDLIGMVFKSTIGQGNDKQLLTSHQVEEKTEKPEENKTKTAELKQSSK